MVQVQVPDGAVEGSTCTFTMPSGAVVQVVVPQGAGPGSVLEVADPGAAKQAVAVQAYTAPHTGVGEVVGIVPHGQISDVSGVQAVGPQMMPPGYDMLGDKYGILARPLAPREEFQSEPGAMVFFSAFQCTNEISRSLARRRGPRARLIRAQATASTCRRNSAASSRPSARPSRARRWLRSRT